MNLTKDSDRSFRHVKDLLGSWLYANNYRVDYYIHNHFLHYHMKNGTWGHEYRTAIAMDHKETDSGYLVALIKTSSGNYVNGLGTVRTRHEEFYSQLIYFCEGSEFKLSSELIPDYDWEWNKGIGVVKDVVNHKDFPFPRNKDGNFTDYDSIDCVLTLYKRKVAIRWKYRGRTVRTDHFHLSDLFI